MKIVAAVLVGFALLGSSAFGQGWLRVPDQLEMMAEVYFSLAPVVSDDDLIAGKLPFSEVTAVEGALRQSRGVAQEKIPEDREFGLKILAVQIMRPYYVFNMEEGKGKIVWSVLSEIVEQDTGASMGGCLSIIYCEDLAMTVDSHAFTLACEGFPSRY